MTRIVHQEVKLTSPNKNMALRLQHLLFFYVATAVAADGLCQRKGCVNAVDRLKHYSEFNPPEIFPPQTSQVVRAGAYYKLNCEGVRAVTWRLPNDATDSLKRRTSISYNIRDKSNLVDVSDQINEGKQRLLRPRGTLKKNVIVYVAVMEISDLTYRDTGTFICVYNGTDKNGSDIGSIDNATGVHLYVSDGQNLLKNDGPLDYYSAVQSQTLVLPCVPTHPEVNVTLWRETYSGLSPVLLTKHISYSPKVGFLISPVMMQKHSGYFVCKAIKGGIIDTYRMRVKVFRQTTYVPPPRINRTMARHIYVGDDFSLRCSASFDNDAIARLTWQGPNDNALKEGRLRITPLISGNLSIGDTTLKFVQKDLTVYSATKADQGPYRCTVIDHSENSQTRSEFVRVLDELESYLRIFYDGYQTLERTVGSTDPVQWVVQIEASTQTIVQWFDPNGKQIIEGDSGEDYTVKTLYGRNSRTMLRVNNPKLSTAGSYTVRVSAPPDHVKSEVFQLSVQAAPSVEVFVTTNRQPEGSGLFKLGEMYTLKCSAKGYPVPTLHWMFKPCTSFYECENKKLQLLSEGMHDVKRASYWRDSITKVVAQKSGKYICQACNKVDCKYDSIPFFVTDVEGNEALSIRGPKQALTGDTVTLSCSAGRYNYTEESLTWYKDTLQGERPFKNSNPRMTVSKRATEFSFNTEIILNNVKLSDKGRYICRAEFSVLAVIDTQQQQVIQEYEEQSLKLNVLETRSPYMIETSMKILGVGEENEDLIVEAEEGLRLTCKVGGLPRPVVAWKLNGKPITGSDSKNRRVYTMKEGQVLIVTYITEHDQGLYECLASNREGNLTALRFVSLKSVALQDAAFAHLSLPIFVAIVVALVAVLVIVAKLCYTGCTCGKKVNNGDINKTGTSSQIMEYSAAFPPALEDNNQDDNCHVTNTTRDESISPLENICSIPARSVCSMMHIRCHSNFQQQPMIQHYGCTCYNKLRPELHPIRCSLCDFQPPHAPLLTETTTLKRGGLAIYKGKYEESDSEVDRKNLSPRLSAEF